MAFVPTSKKVERPNVYIGTVASVSCLCTGTNPGFCEGKDGCEIAGKEEEGEKEKSKEIERKMMDGKKTSHWTAQKPEGESDNRMGERNTHN